MINNFYWNHFFGYNAYFWQHQALKWIYFAVFVLCLHFLPILCLVHILISHTRQDFWRGCERDEVHTNVDIHTLMRESLIMRQDIREILISFDSGLIYRHDSKSFEMRWEQVGSVEDEKNLPFTLAFSSCLVLSRWECKAGIKDDGHWLHFHTGVIYLGLV